MAPPEPPSPEPRPPGFAAPEPARPQQPDQGPPATRPPLQPPRYGRYVALLALVILVLITVNTLVTKPNGEAGVAPGTAVPPFAVPLATSDLGGDADVATRADEGGAGRVPACAERGPRILNICQLYEQGPVVLALFVDAGGCPDVLAEMQALVGSFPSVRFAAVSLLGSTSSLRKLIRGKGLTFPVGIDRDGALAALYKVATCTQVSLIARGGTMREKALTGTPSPALLRARVAALAAAPARGGGG